jgi:hypothetical protein
MHGGVGGRERGKRFLPEDDIDHQWHF